MDTCLDTDTGFLPADRLQTCNLELEGTSSGLNTRLILMLE
jgi:hypothetical protein